MSKQSLPRNLAVNTQWEKEQEQQFISKSLFSIE